MTSTHKGPLPGQPAVIFTPRTAAAESRGGEPRGPGGGPRGRLVHLPLWRVANRFIDCIGHIGHVTVAADASLPEKNSTTYLNDSYSS